MLQVLTNEKHFSENYQPMRVWLWLVWKFTENCCSLQLFSDFIQTRRRHPTSQEKISILTWKLLLKLKLFLWTKLVEKLLIPKYVISAAPALILSELNEILKKKRLSYGKKYIEEFVRGALLFWLHGIVYVIFWRFFYLLSPFCPLRS